MWQDPDGSIRTRNNRLLRYYEGVPEERGGEQRLVRTVWYTYYATGDVSNITVKDEDPSGGDPNNPNDPNNPYTWYHDLALYYSFNHALQHAVWDRWQLDPNTNEFVPDSGHLLWRRDFQYDAPRELVRVQDYAWTWGRWDATGLAEQRTDYVGEQPYQDYTTLATWSDPNVAWSVETAETRRHFGSAEQPLDPNDPSVPLGTQWRHGDLIASTMLLTDEAGSAASAVLAYTAFGEPVFDPNTVATRYQYAGGWGYETGRPTNEPNVVPPNDLLGLRGANPSLPPITLLHVGARWYDPALGRFVQRDPVGIGGGINAYAYTESSPVNAVDPSGLQVIVEPPAETIPPRPSPRPLIRPRPTIDVPDTPWTDSPMPRSPQEAAHGCLANIGLVQRQGEWEYSDEPPPWMRPAGCPVCGQPGCTGHIGATPTPTPPPVQRPRRPWEDDPKIPVY